MKRKVLTGGVAAIIGIGLVGIAHASLVVYHDQTSFLAASGSVDVYDFESDTPGYISAPSYSGGHPGAVQDFGDFSIDATSNGIYQANIRSQNGNNDVYGDFYNNNAALNVIFDKNITAVGFTYVAEGNQNWDHSTVSLLNTTWDLGIPGDSGFFGVIEDSGTIAAGTPISFGQQSSNWSGVSFDNLTYTSNGPSPAPVPEPATMLLFATGLAGIAGLRRGKK